MTAIRVGDRHPIQGNILQFDEASVYSSNIARIDKFAWVRMRISLLRRQGRTATSSEVAVPKRSRFNPISFLSLSSHHRDAPFRSAPCLGIQLRRRSPNVRQGSNGVL